MMRPVILSSPSKTAIGWLILSASAASGARSAAIVAAASAGLRLAAAECAGFPIARAKSMGFMAGDLLVNGGGNMAVRLRGRDSRPHNRRQWVGADPGAASTR